MVSKGVEDWDACSDEVDEKECFGKLDYEVCSGSALVNVEQEAFVERAVAEAEALLR